LIERLVQRRCRTSSADKRCYVFSAAGEGNGDDAASLFQRRMLDCVAEYERALIAQRTRAALRAKRARGERAGNVPFGYQLAADGVRLEPAPDEQRIIAAIRELRAAGCTLRRITDALNAEGLTTRRGSPWRYQYVANLVAAQQLAA